MIHYLKNKVGVHNRFCNWYLKPTINFNQQEIASKLPSELEKALSFFRGQAEALEKKKNGFCFTTYSPLDSQRHVCAFGG